MMARSRAAAASWTAISSLQNLMPSLLLPWLDKNWLQLFLSYGTSPSRRQDEAPGVDNSHWNNEPPPPVTTETTRGWPGPVLRRPLPLRYSSWMAIEAGDGALLANERTWRRSIILSD